MNPYNGFSPRERIRALAWLKGEYAAGRRQPPIVCDACGQTAGLLEAHSEDYSTPYGDHTGAFGLCWTCHMMIHCRFKAAAAWERYRTAVAAGATAEPFQIRNFRRFTAMHLGAVSRAAWTQRPAPPARLILDEIERSGGNPPLRG
jgi:hypothetical protein